MPPDDAFKWIAEIPPISEGPAGLFPSIDDSVSRRDFMTGWPLSKLDINDVPPQSDLPSLSQSTDSLVSSPRRVSKLASDALAPTPPPQPLSRPLSRPPSLPLARPPSLPLPRPLTGNPPSRTTLQPQAQAPESERRRRLEETDWLAIHDVCRYFDRHLEEKIDEDTTLNTVDMHNAARALNLTLSSAMVEALVQIGWRVPEFAKSRTPWSQAADSLERDLRQREHEEYLIEQRHEKRLLSEQLQKKLALSSSIRLWRIALEDIAVSNAILHRYDVAVVVPKYVMLWRRKTRLLALRKEGSTEAANTRAVRQCLDKWLEELERVSGLEQTARHLGTRLCLQTALDVWRRRNTHTKQAEQLRARILQKFVVNQLRSSYHQAIAARSYVRLCKKKYLGSWLAKLAEIDTEKAKGAKYSQKAVLHCWEKRLADLRTDRGRELSLKRYVGHWRHKTWVSQCRRRTDTQVKRDILNQWRLAAKREKISRDLAREKTRVAVKTWQQRVRRVQEHAERAASLTLSANTYGARLVTQLWQARLRMVQSLANGRLATTVLERKALDMVVCRAKELASARVRARELNDHRLEMKYWQVLSTRSDRLRTDRLGGLLAECGARVDRRGAQTIVGHWRQAARKQAAVRRNVGWATAQGEKQGVVASWTRQLHGLRDMEVLAHKLRRRYLQQMFLQVWAARADEVRLLETAYEDINIARLALVMRAQTRRWQRQSASQVAQSAQAANMRAQASRRLQLSVLNAWRDRVSSSGGGSANTSIFDSPSKLTTISPRLISKWRSPVPATPRTRNAPDTPTKPLRSR